jgi:hypothetical protein
MIPFGAELKRLYPFLMKADAQSKHFNISTNFRLVNDITAKICRGRVSERLKIPGGSQVENYFHKSTCII